MKIWKAFTIKERYYRDWRLVKEKVVNMTINRNVKTKELLGNNKCKPGEVMSGAAARTGNFT